MSRTSVELNDVPDEVLCLIADHLPTYRDVQSLACANKRSHSVIGDPRWFASFLWGRLGDQSVFVAGATVLREIVAVHGEKVVVEVRDNDGMTLLMRACDVDDCDADVDGVIAFILSLPAVANNINLLCPYDHGKSTRTLLHNACLCGNERAVRTLLAVPGIDANKEGHGAWSNYRFGNETPLQIAIDGNRVGCARILLSHPGTDVNKSSDGRRPLVQVVRWLQICKDNAETCEALRSILAMLLAHPDLDVDSTCYTDKDHEIRFVNRHMCMQLLRLGQACLAAAISSDCRIAARELMHHPKIAAWFHDDDDVATTSTAQ